MQREIPYGYDENGPISPLDQPYPIILDPTAQGFPLGSIKSPEEIFMDYYLRPVMDDLSIIPKDVAQLEISDRKLVLKVCRATGT